MECSCSINSSYDYDSYEVFESKIMTSRKDHKCGECGKIILKGDLYERCRGLYDGHWYNHKTCKDCLSFRTSFFDNWSFESLWEDFQETMDDCGWQVPEKCLSKVTPATRTRICEMIEEYWEEE
jgi:hypothetical protein